jgi:hypothetical protein
MPRQYYYMTRVLTYFWRIHIKRLQQTPLEKDFDIFGTTGFSLRNFILII